MEMLNLGYVGEELSTAPSNPESPNVATNFVAMPVVKEPSEIIEMHNLANMDFNWVSTCSNSPLTSVTSVEGMNNNIANTSSASSSINVESLVDVVLHLSKGNNKRCTQKYLRLSH